MLAVIWIRVCICCHVTTVLLSVQVVFLWWQHSSKKVPPRKSKWSRDNIRWKHSRCDLLVSDREHWGQLGIFVLCRLFLSARVCWHEKQIVWVGLGGRLDMHAWSRHAHDSQCSPLYLWPSNMLIQNSIAGVKLDMDLSVIILSIYLGFFRSGDSS